MITAYLARCSKLDVKSDSRVVDNSDIDAACAMEVHRNEADRVEYELLREFESGCLASFASPSSRVAHVAESPNRRAAESPNRRPDILCATRHDKQRVFAVG